jgi:hypothetical protein
MGYILLLPGVVVLLSRTVTTDPGEGVPYTSLVTTTTPPSLFTISPSHRHCSTSHCSSLSPLSLSLLHLTALCGSPVLYPIQVLCSNINIIPDRIAQLSTAPPPLGYPTALQPHSPHSTSNRTDHDSPAPLPCHLSKPWRTLWARHVRPTRSAPRQQTKRQSSSQTSAARRSVAPRHRTRRPKVAQQVHQATSRHLHRRAAPQA